MVKKLHAYIGSLSMDLDVRIQKFILLFLKKNNISII